MFHVIRPADQKRSDNGTVAFEGRPYGGGVSVFLVDAAPGEGPALHLHPYSETWVVHAGKAAMKARIAVWHSGSSRNGICPRSFTGT